MHASRRGIKFLIAAAVLVGGYGYAGLGAGGRAMAQGPPPLPLQELGPGQVEVLTRGPVNEAFAEPINVQVQAPLVVNKEPPPAIDEDPPADRPEGDNYVWVSGYWAWDADRGDFIWVSACWRAAPPHRVWVPGYWAAVTETRTTGRGVDVSVGGVFNVQVGHPRAEQVTVGWEWIPGFWAPAGLQEIEYLPAPPEPIDIAPPGPPPQADNTWVPGCWYWRDNHYVRRPGYWLREQSGWVWAPSHYLWTPRGYIFVDGHWDYSLDRRGVLFAPVYFPRDVYARRGFRYTPSVVLDVRLLSGSLFTYPRYSHYYFGDYYDDAYLRVGIYPRFECETDHSWYDPLYQHDRWRNVRTDSRWSQNNRKEYDRRRADKDLRPPRTYRELEKVLPRLSEPQRRTFQLAQPLSAAVSARNTTMKFGRINTDERRRLTDQTIEAHKFRQERGRIEAAATPPTGRRGPAALPSDGRGTAARAPAHVAPPDVQLKQAERVRINFPLFRGRPTGPAGAVKALPYLPPDGSRNKGDDRDQSRDQGGRRGG